MNAHAALEMLGYAASVMVAVSLMMKSLLRLRLLNLVGALMLSLYGVLIHAYPVAGLNGLIAIVDLYFLVQMLRQRDYFTLLEVAHDSEYLRGFVDFHRKDIAGFVPDYTYEPEAGHLNLLVLRNMVPAGVMIARREESTARVLLDYVIPGYRDFAVGKFLFEERSGWFRSRGVHRFVSAPGHPRHAAYLERMGFRRAAGDYVRELPVTLIRDGGL